MPNGRSAGLFLSHVWSHALADTMRRIDAAVKAAVTVDDKPPAWAALDLEVGQGQRSIIIEVSSRVHDSSPWWASPRSTGTWRTKLTLVGFRPSFSGPTQRWWFVTSLR